MDCVSKKLQKELSGFTVRIENINGNSLKLFHRERDSGKVFEANVLYSQLDQKAQILFQSLDELYNYIEECLRQETSLVSVQQNGYLCVGAVFRSITKKIIIPTIEKEMDKVDRLFGINAQLFKEVYKMKSSINFQGSQEVEQLKKQFSTQIEKFSSQIFKEILTIKAQMRVQYEQFQQNKIKNQKLINENQLGIQSLNESITEEINRLRAEIAQANQENNTLMKQELLESIEERINEISQEQRNSITKIEQIKYKHEATVQLQQLRLEGVKQQISKMAENSSILALKLEINENKQSNIDDQQTWIKTQLRKLTQTNFAMQTQITFAIPLLKQKRFPFEVDQELEVFKNHWKFDNESKIVQKTRVNGSSKFVSKAPLPAEGRCYFEVRCIELKQVFIGIVTEAGRDDYWSIQTKEALTYRSTLCVCTMGKAQPKVQDKDDIKNNSVVSVFIDRTKKEISWYVDHQLHILTKLPQRFQNVPIYATVAEWQREIKSKFICRV